MLELFWTTGWNGGGANLGCMCNLLEVAEHKVNSGSVTTGSGPMVLMKMV